MPRGRSLPRKTAKATSKKRVHSVGNKPRNTRRIIARPLEHAQLVRPRRAMPITGLENYFESTGLPRGNTRSPRGTPYANYYKVAGPPSPQYLQRYPSVERLNRERRFADLIGQNRLIHMLEQGINNNYDAELAEYLGEAPPAPVPPPVPPVYTHQEHVNYFHQLNPQLALTRSESHPTRVLNHPELYPKQGSF